MNMDSLNNDEEANEGYRGSYMLNNLDVSTNNITVCTSDTMNETIVSLDCE